MNTNDEVTGLLVGELRLDHLFVWFDDLLHNTSPDAQLEVFNTAGERLFPVNGVLLPKEVQTALNKTSAENSSPAFVEQVEGGVFVNRTMYPITVFEGTLIRPYTVSAQGQWTSNARALNWQAQIFLSKAAWFPKSILAQPWAQGVLGVLLIGLAVGCWLLARTQRMRAWVASMQTRYADELSDLYENAPVCYQSVGADGYYVRMNQTGLDWLGYTREEVIGKMHYREILQPEMDAYGNLKEDYLDILSQPQGVLQDYPMWMRRKDGSHFPVSLSASLVHDDRQRLLLVRTSITDRTHRYQLEERLRELAYTDELTGAINRRQFFAMSEMILKRGERENTHHVLLALDIDHFKRVNDTYGHDIGDETLKVFVKTCVQSVRTSDLVARLGGEEFSILLLNQTMETGLVVAERIRANVQALKMPMKDGSVLQFTVSIGVSTLTTTIGLDAALKLADERLYAAKAMGRNRVVSTSETDAE
ncbi:sensor domain-containing diguanylate cyclase [Orrella sp. 11846]|uniref:sensor domain-containing diguanylate cyclase n=1 Tax=Orrella sp. 11846 TaxID=3409913 RepID=UPI003B5B237A